MVREAAQNQRQLRTYSFTEITSALLGLTTPWFSGNTIAAKLSASATCESDLQELLRYSYGLAQAARSCVTAMNCVTEAATLARVTGQSLASVWTRGKSKRCHHSKLDF
jgi:hypothetical protein